MSNHQQAQPKSFLGRVLSYIFRLIIGLLVLGIVISAVQVVTAWQQQRNQSNQLQEQTQARQADYAATATAIAPEDSARNPYFQFVQFVTNTPLPDNDVATEVVPTDVPVQATQAPAQSTPIILPTFDGVQDAEKSISSIQGSQLIWPPPVQSNL